MDTFTEDSDSDVEILEPEVLKYRYRCQEIRLITELSKCELHIPKKWEDFQIFVQDELKFHLSPHLVRSVWVQLHSLINSVSDSVEIIDEEEDQEIARQHNKFFSNVGYVISKELKPDNKGQWSNSPKPSAYLEIVDEEDSKEFVKQNNHDDGGFFQEEIIPSNNGEKSFCAQSSNSLEIIDEDEGREVVKQRNHKSFSNTEGFILQELKLSNKRKESCRSFNSLETINEEREINVNQHDDHFINIQESEPDKKRRKSINTQSSDCLEIIDEKECVQVTKQHCKQFVKIGGAFQEKLKPGEKREKFFSEPLSNCFEIIDGEDEEIVKKHNEHFNVGGTIHDGLNNRNQDKEFCSQQSSDCVEISDDEEVKPIKQENFTTTGGVDHERSKPDIKEEKTNNDTLVSDCIEISDEESEEVVNHYEQLSSIREMNPDINGVKFDNKQLPDYLEISDEEQNTYQNHVVAEPNGISETSDSISNSILERSFSNPKGHKRKYNRRSLPASMKEAEAEALREKLLLDKIIELELPQVIKSFMKKNNIIKKRRKKSSINKKESISGTSSDGCVPASDIV